MRNSWVGYSATELSQWTDTRRARRNRRDGTWWARNQNPAELPRKRIWYKNQINVKDVGKMVGASFQHLVLVRPLARHQGGGPITLQLLLLPATICTLVVPAIISSVAIYSLFTHVPHQGTSAMVSFPSLHFIVQSSSSYLFSIFCRCSFLSIIVVLFWGERSFTGRNRFPSSKMRALSRDYQNAIARRKDAP